MDNQAAQLFKMFATYAQMVNAQIAALQGRVNKLEATIFQVPELQAKYDAASQKTTSLGFDASLQRQLSAIQSLLPKD